MPQNETKIFPTFALDKHTYSKVIGEYSENQVPLTLKRKCQKIQKFVHIGEENLHNFLTI